MSTLRFFLRRLNSALLLAPLIMLTASAAPVEITMMIAPNARMRIVAQGATMSRLVDVLGLQVDRPIVDMTGLAGNYDITFEFAPDQAMLQAKMAAMGVPPPPPDGVGPTMPDNGPMASLFTALPEQLGLRLEARNVPVRTFVIDSADKPTVDAAGEPPPAPVAELAPVMRWKSSGESVVRAGRV